MRVNGRATVICICFLLAVSAFGQTIPLIEPPQVPPGEGYQFVVFGDSRTAGEESTDPHDVAFHHIRDMVYRQVSSLLNRQEASFALFSGDLIWQGGVKYYWDELETVLTEGVRKKFYPVIGNHEAWQGKHGAADPLQFYFDAFPHIKGLHNYAFKIGRSLFVNLCSGVYGEAYSPFKAYRWDQEWNCKKWTFSQVKAAMQELLDEGLAAEEPLQNVFVQYHKPSYSYYGHPPLKSKNDPVQLLLPYKEKYPSLKVFVFNGHNHTTEMYRPAAGVWVIVAGGGGAPQPTGPKTNCNIKDEPELFWKALGKPLMPREHRVNYFVVTVKTGEGKVTIREKCLMGTPQGTVFFGDGVVIADDTLQTPSPDLDTFIKIFYRQ
jgi:hypothetical protein